MCDHCGCREFGPIADLTAEHEDILAMAWAVAEDPERSSPARLADRDRLLALLDRHVIKEEVGLYPRLIEAGSLDPGHSGTLEEEHRTSREALVTGSFDRRDYYALAAHIEEEEMELFAAAMLAFDDDVWEHLEVVRRDASASSMAATPS